MRGEAFTLAAHVATTDLSTYHTLFASYDGSGIETDEIEVLYDPSQGLGPPWRCPRRRKRT